MKGDFTRSTFQPKKHYSSVRMQQGRLQLDADWNEQADIQNYLNQSQAKDVIGDSGISKNDGGFQIEVTPDGTDLKIGFGHIYVDGILCELEPGTPFSVKSNDKNKVQVSTLKVDGRNLEVGQWLEILPDTTSNEQRLVQITGVDFQQLELTLNEDVENPSKLRRVTTYKTQPDHPKPLQVDVENGSLTKDATYVTYLDVWQRHIGAIEDPEIHEVALSVPDTATRTKIIWQLKLLELSKNSSDNQNSDKWQDLIKDRKAYLTARVNSAPETTNASGTNYGRLENQLYRVEIHTPGKVGVATFKWSRDNGSIVSAIESIEGNTITIRQPGRDASQSFASGQWVEIIDEERELNNQPGTLVRLTSGTSGTTLVCDRSTVVGTSIDPENFPKLRKPKVRRWDRKTAVEITKASVWLPLENGIEVKFEAEEDSSYQTGDYWLIPARSVTNAIDWPRDDLKQPLPQPPQGIQHHYCRIALLQLENGKLIRKEVYRNTFPALVNCLDKTGDIMTGSLEIQANLNITGKGKVGIGTTTPKQQLVVAENGKVGIGYNDPQQTAALAIKGNIGIGTVTPKQQLVIDNGQVAIGYNLENQTAALAIKGNIGIGTVIPQQKLVIDNGQAAIGYNKQDQTAALAINGNIGIGTYKPEQQLVIDNGKVAIGYNQAEQTAALAINGNIGIGTYKPEQKLVINNGKAAIGYNKQEQTAALAINGNIGIGTITPQQQLVVENGKAAIGYNQPEQTAALAINGNIGIGTITPQQQFVVENGKAAIGYNQPEQTAALAINGNIGIGTITPQQQLVVENGKAAIGYNQPEQTAALAVKGFLGLGTTQPQQQFVVAENGKVGIGYNDLQQTAALAVNGRLGLGTSQPQQQFVIEKGQVGIGYNDPQQTATLAIAGNVGIGTPHPKNTLDVSGGVAIGVGVAGTNAAPANGLLVEGNVGIGTTEAVSKLEVQGAAAIPARGTISSDRITVQISNTPLKNKPHIGDTIAVADQTRIITAIADDGKSLTVNAPFDSALSAEVSFTYQQPIVRLADSNQITQLIVNGKGNIGIGTTFPEAKLQVTGTVKINGHLYTNELSQISAREFKDNVVDISSQEVAEILKALNPVKFSYKTDKDQKLHTGFIAEDVPELLTSPDNKAINTLEIVAILTKAVKDHQRIIATLTKVVKEQQQQIAKLTEKPKGLE